MQLCSLQEADGGHGTRPLLNGRFTFAAGVLDQSWWPDGQYTAPTDDALAYDVQMLSMFGLNMIRLHQKVNPERWYYHTDKAGVLIFQDMPQKLASRGSARAETIPYFIADLRAMIKGRRNHPSVVQWTMFNEDDCIWAFTTPAANPWTVGAVVALAKQLDPTRLVDTLSGGVAGQNSQIPNLTSTGDVEDLHSYPYPSNPQPSTTQYAMIGEFGGLGIQHPIGGVQHMWSPKGCWRPPNAMVPFPHNMSVAYVAMAATIQGRVDHVSASVYTQTTDIESECDGFLSYDRTIKFNDADTKAIAAANQAIIIAAADLHVIS